MPPTCRSAAGAGPPATVCGVPRVAFFDEELSREQFKFGLSAAGMALVGAGIVVASLLVPDGIHVRWVDAGIGLGLFAVAGAYVATKARLVRRAVGDVSTDIRFDPRLILFLLVMAIAALALINVAADDHTSTYLSSYLGFVVLSGIIGNITMRLLVWVATTVALVVSGIFVAPTDVASFWVATAVTICVAGLAEGMIGATMTNLSGRNAQRGAINALVEAAAGVDSLDEGLATCLPLVTSIVPADHVTVLQRLVGEQQYSVVAEWPEATADGGRSEADPHFLEAMRSSPTMVTAEHCYIPIGYTGAGELSMVVTRKPTRGYPSRYPQEAADALAACFLRLTARITHVNRLTLESLTDPLTNLPNRRMLVGRLEFEMARAKRDELALSVAMIDVDLFKDYNDSFGHPAGDRLLRGIAEMMSKRLRTQDLAARYGGEEFCVVLPETSIGGAVELVEDLRQRVCRIGGPRPVTISAGVASWHPSESMDELIRRADDALYQAKNSGRDRVVLARSADPAAGLGRGVTLGPTARSVLPA